MNAAQKLLFVLGSQGLLLYDAFDGSGALDAHTIAPINRVGASWTDEADDWTLTDGYAYPAVDASRTQVDVGRSTYIVAASIMTDDTPITDLKVRIVNTSQHFTLRVDTSADKIRIYEAPSYTLRAEKSVALSPSTIYNAESQVTAAQITFTVSGATAAYASTTYNTATAVGMNGRSYGGPPNRYYDFKVYNK